MSYSHRVKRFVTSIMLLALISPLVVAEENEATITVDPQSLDSALKDFSDQSGLQIAYVATLTNNKTSPGTHNARTLTDALDAILDNTGLEYQFVNDDTVAIGVADDERGISDLKNSSPSPILMAQASVIQSTASQTNSRSNADETEEKKEVVIDEILVTGSRIRMLAGEQTAQPVLTITRRDIERYGISNLAEIFRYIPQVSSVALGQPLQGGNSSPLQANVVSGRITATLRGAPGDGTLILINGRRAPKNGQGGGRDAYDISGIPVAAIERVEVLLDGASSVYGADAVGGVINVILRDNYRGAQASFGYGTTEESDSDVTSASFTYGFGADRFSGLLTAAWEDAEGMMWRDRSFLSTVDRRPWGGDDNRTLSDGRGTISSFFGNLPGLSVSQVVIPAGSDGVNVTLADYANSALVPDELRDRGEIQQYSAPYRRRSVAMHFEYDVSDHIEFFYDGRWGDNQTASSSTPILAISTLIPPGMPGNVFDTFVVLNKTFYDLPIQVSEATNTNSGHVLGARGDIWRDWHYEFAASQTLSRLRLHAEHGLALTPFGLLSAPPSPAQQPILLYDSTVGGSANPVGIIEGLSNNPSEAERVEAWTYDLKIDGPLASLPAGELRAAFGAEYRDEKVNFPLVPAGAAVPEGRSRYAAGYYAELLAPLLTGLEANVSVRHDRYSGFPESTNVRYSLLYRPVPWLLLRGSRGKGYKVPTLTQLHRPFTQNFGITFVTGVTDPMRGNQSVSGLFFFDAGGNANLTPERSINTTVGTVIDFPFIPGLSLSLGYYDTEYRDRVGSLSLADRLVLFPQSVYRGDNLPSDPPDWAGPITGFVDLPINIATNRVSGYDLALKYTKVVGFGEITANAYVNYTSSNEVHAVPGGPLTITSTKDALPLQANGSVFWSRGAGEIGVLLSYREKYRRNNLPTTQFTPSALRLDFQGSYDLASSNWLSATIFSDTRVNLSIFNVLNTEPPFDANGYPDNRVLDSRLRRYSLQLVKQF